MFYISLISNDICFEMVFDLIAAGRIEVVLSRGVVDFSLLCFRELFTLL